MRRREFTGLTGTALLTAVTRPTTGIEDLATAAAEAMESTRRASTSAIGRSSLAHITSAVASITSGYARRPPADLSHWPASTGGESITSSPGRTRFGKGVSFSFAPDGCRRSSPGSLMTWVIR